MKRIFCLLTALFFLTSLPAQAATRLYDPVAVISYDQTSLEDWTSNYGLSVPGILLELNHPEGMISITALESNELNPDVWLDSRLDHAGETLAVSNAEITEWPDPFDGDGRQLSFSYTYPDGDELHLARFFVASWENMLVEISIDVWGTEAVSLMDAAVASLIEGGFTLNCYKNAYEMTALLSDVSADDDGGVQLYFSSPTDSLDGSFYPLSTDAVVLFPHPDDPSAVYPVSPDISSLVDAVLNYEESGDSPAVFRVILQDGVIVCIEYSPTI